MTRIKNIRKYNYAFIESFNMGISTKLIEILKQVDDDILSREVSSKLHIYMNKLAEIDNLNSYYEYYLMFVYLDTKEIIKNTKYPIAVKTHFSNLITAIYRSKLKERKLRKIK